MNDTPESPNPADTKMITALVQLRGALREVALPLELPGVEEQRTALGEMVDQLEDYVIPRLMTIDAPMLAVVGGSTGAGKSTLVNSLVGTAVTKPGLLRPTTRSPVLVHHPADARWFGQDRLLPELERVSTSTNDPDALQLVASESVPLGLAILDAPDIDSVEERNRTLAAQLLAAADLWLFVTSAARYADQVPWDFLRSAAERSAAVAIVLDRTAPEAIEQVSTHCAIPPCSPWPRRCLMTRGCCLPSRSPRSAAGCTRWPPTPTPGPRWSSRPCTEPYGPCRAGRTPSLTLPWSKGRRPGVCETTSTPLMTGH
jgi:energy-coupling factor transporter ATP-binding protein EcfA2